MKKEKINLDKRQRNLVLEPVTELDCLVFTGQFAKCKNRNKT